MKCSKHFYNNPNLKTAIIAIPVIIVLLKLLEWLVKGVVGMFLVSGHILPLLIDHGNTTPPVPVKSRNHLHILRRQLKIHHLQRMRTELINFDVV